MKKLFYSAPVTEVLSLVSIQETMQAASEKAGTTSRGFVEAQSFTDDDWD